MEYRTVRAFAMDEFVEKKSRFIGHIAPVSSEEEAIAFINEMRAKYRDATHNVYAYSLRENQIKRASDDGEPQGTGGVPILSVLNGSGLVDVCCVVTRYFGGTLLGVGGLVRAYTEGAKIAVNAAEIKVMAESVDLAVTTDYGLYGKLEHYLNEHGVLVLSTDFGADVKATVRLRQEDAAEFEHGVTELSSAKALIEKIAEGWNEM
ncbi:MAG: YigZ family protein [Oscillospiraceae bacterium]